MAKTRESLVVTKRGKALVRLVPYQPISSAPVSGKLADALVFEKDIVSPVATAREENATILTSDERIRSYPHCRSLW